MAACSNVCGYHVEVLQKENSMLSDNKMESLVSKFLSTVTISEENYSFTSFSDPEMKEHIESISICDHIMEKGTSGIAPKVFFHIYRFNSDSPVQQDDEDEQITTQWTLPTTEFHGLWDSLIYDYEVKEELLNYVSTALLFSNKGVNPNIVSWNRVVLLHGPPGTGKTSLCKALAQKLCIRFRHKYTHGLLVEINTHSLFSKWFSESGKLVTKMFQTIQCLLVDERALVIVLVDEVESLAHSRKAALNGTEPSDSIRVVNALLTQLDQIKRYPNVLILTTSNMTEAIDLALVDRADIKQYIGLPSVDAIYQIYYSCIRELQRTGVICLTDNVYTLAQIKSVKVENDFKAGNHAFQLKSLALRSYGLSGRALRKIPFIALSLFVKTNLVGLDMFLNALSGAIEKQFNDNRLLCEEQSNTKQKFKINVNPALE